MAMSILKGNRKLHVEADEVLSRRIVYPGLGVYTVQSPLALHKFWLHHILLLFISTFGFV